MSCRTNSSMVGRPVACLPLGYTRHALSASHNDGASDSGSPVRTSNIQSRSTRASAELCQRATSAQTESGKVGIPVISRASLALCSLHSPAVSLVRMVHSGGIRARMAYNCGIIHWDVSSPHVYPSVPKLWMRSQTLALAHAQILIGVGDKFSNVAYLRPRYSSVSSWRPLRFERRGTGTRHGPGRA